MFVFIVQNVNLHSSRTIKRKEGAVQVEENVWKGEVPVRIKKDFPEKENVLKKVENEKNVGKVWIKVERVPVSFN